MFARLNQCRGETRRLALWLACGSRRGSGLGIFHGAPEHLDAALRWAREQTLPDLARLPGFKGLYLLVDRQTGKGVAISLWQTEAALHASEDVVRPHRAVEGRTPARACHLRGGHQPRDTCHAHSAHGGCWPLIDPEDPPC